MNSEALFSMALALQSPWEVREVNFVASESGRNELHLRIGFPSGSRFADESEVLCGVHDTVERRWQYLSFFEHMCYLHCAVPRIKTSGGKVAAVVVQALIEREMPLSRVGEMMQVHSQLIWTVFNH